MRIFIFANEDQQTEIQTINVGSNNELVFSLKPPGSEAYKNYDSFFFLSESSHLLDFRQFRGKPVFINSVIDTLSQLKLPLNVSRINAWPGFLQRDIWEVATHNPKGIENNFKSLNRKFFFVKDEPGLVAARVISMIINEAFFEVGEEVSSQAEIDLAMKSGTNYPFGPFEWAERIGIGNIYHLLAKLSEKDQRYLPAPALKNLFRNKYSQYQST